MKVIGIDLMGGDLPPETIALAIIQATEEGLEGDFVFFADASIQHLKLPKNITHFVCDQVISMDDHPIAAYRSKTDSSMMLGLKALKEGSVDALISSGNTGALVTGATLMLPKIAPIKRPALLTNIPTSHGMVSLLDAGANLQPSESSLVHYALLGIAYRMCLGHSQPKVGYLNIGTEEKKGTLAMQQASKLLHKECLKTPATFLGNVEPRDVFFKPIDVLVTDAIFGNLFLKSCEGISMYFAHLLKDKLPSEVAQSMDYQTYPGAILYGLEQMVVKCHGNSSVYSFINTIKQTMELLNEGLIAEIKQLLCQMNQDTAVSS